MTRPRPEAEERRRTVCPACRSVIVTGGVRCPRCFARLEELPALSGEQVAARIREHDEGHRRQLSRRRRRRVFLAGLALAVVAAVAWFAWPRGAEPVPAASTTLAVQPGPGAWPMVHADLRGTRSTTAGVALHAPVAWRAALGSPPAVPLVSDGQAVYLALEDGRRVALEAESGDLRWARRHDNPPFAAPTAAGDLLFVPERGGTVAAYEAGSGEPRWRLNLNTLLAAPLPVMDGAIYAYAQDGLHVIDAARGELLRTVDIDTKWHFVAPAIDGEHLVLTTDVQMHIYDRTTGQRVYWFDFPRAHPFAAALDGDVAYIASERSAGAFHVESRRPWWEELRAPWFQFYLWGMAPEPPPAPALWIRPRPLPGLQFALDDSALYFARRSGEVRALDRGDGEIRWRTPLHPIVAAPILTADGLLVIGERSITLIDPGSGEIVDERSVEDGPLRDGIVTERGIYLATEDGTLLAIAADR